MPTKKSAATAPAQQKTKAPTRTRVSKPVARIKSKKFVKSPSTLALEEAGYHIEGPAYGKDLVSHEHKANQKPILEVVNLKKVFGKGKKRKVAVDGISFSVYEGENLALLGANGAGKTTTVEIVAGINKPTSGTVRYNYPYKNTFHEGLGIQFQDSSYPEGLSCRNVIDFMLETYLVKMTPAELDEMITIFGVKEFYKKSARSLSGGQQQRLNILLSLIHRPRLVFLDELSTGLDIKVRAEIKRFIKDYTSKHNITIVLISHDMTEVEELCNRVVIMSDGKIAEDLKMSEVITKYGRVETLAEKYI